MSDTYYPDRGIIQEQWDSVTEKVRKELAIVEDFVIAGAANLNIGSPWEPVVASP